MASKNNSSKKGQNLNEKSFRLNSYLALGLFGLILGYAALRMAFPAFSYTTVPMANGSLRVEKQIIGSQSMLVATPALDHNYHKLQLTLKLKEPISFSQKAKKGFQVHKAYPSQFYPLGETLETPAELRNHLFSPESLGLANGQLVANKKAVYRISQGQRIPFAEPEIFTGLGYSWDEVVPVENLEVDPAQLERGELIQEASFHPSGTILEDPSGELFLVWERQRLPIASRDLLKEFYPDFYTIKTKEAQPQEIGFCRLQGVEASKTSCSLDLPKEIGELPGSYVLIIEGNLAEKITHAQVRFDTLGNFDSQTARISLKNIKDQLYIRYREELGN
jgi:hypothetical protein